MSDTTNQKHNTSSFSFITYLKSLTNPFQKGIEISFFSLFFLLPLFFFPSTSELFEFNKMFLVYIVTTMVIALWATDMVLQGKIIFRRTLLDVPLLFFLASQGFATIFSIDPHTSLLGYYSRWNGGLISLVSYSVLYWAFVTYMNKRSVQKIFMALFSSTAIVSMWGVLEHFGRSPSCLLITGNFDVNCWIQDVALRVFATFGQPNWLAAWLVAVLPLTWVTLMSDTFIKRLKRWHYVILSLLLFVTLLFTKSRSGLLAFGVSFIIFWGAVTFPLLLGKRKDLFKKHLTLPLIHLISFIILILWTGTPWTPSLYERFRSNTTVTTEKTAEVQGPSLETGGTESGTIRKIVWEGALNVWLLYPVFGSGVETFAYSYYEGRPLAHNLTSEWNFLYNKAHNEYLNYLATTGIVGLGSYLILLGVTIVLFLKPTKTKNENNEPLLRAALLASYISILITNFFGFSVVATNVLLFILPAFYMSIQVSEDASFEKSKNLFPNKVFLVGIALFTLFALYKISTYWYADNVYAEALAARTQENYEEAIKKIEVSIHLNASEAIYHDFLAQTLATVAVGIYPDDPKSGESYAEAALVALKKTHELSPRNIKLLKSEINALSDLSEIDQKHLLAVRSRLTDLMRLAPTDPSAVYQLGLTYAKLGMTTEAIDQLEKVLLMKPDYKIARRLLAFLYKETENVEGAKEQLKYILTHISPSDTDVQKDLKELEQ